jgi:hypothetical protein
MTLVYTRYLADDWDFNAGELQLFSMEDMDLFVNLNVETQYVDGLEGPWALLEDHVTPHQFVLLARRSLCLEDMQPTRPPPTEEEAEHVELVARFDAIPLKVMKHGVSFLEKFPLTQEMWVKMRMAPAAAACLAEYLQYARGLKKLFFDEVQDADVEEIVKVLRALNSVKILQISFYQLTHETYVTWLLDSVASSSLHTLHLHAVPDSLHVYECLLRCVQRQKQLTRVVIHNTPNQYELLGRIFRDTPRLKVLEAAREPTNQERRFLHDLFYTEPMFNIVKIKGITPAEQDECRQRWLYNAGLVRRLLGNNPWRIPHESLNKICFKLFRLI